MIEKSNIRWILKKIKGDSDAQEHLIIWAVFTVFLAFFPLLCKLLVFCALSKTLSLSDALPEHMFVTILLSADSIKTTQVNSKRDERDKSVKKIFWINIVSILITTVIYTLLIVAQYNKSFYGIYELKYLIYGFLISALIINIASQLTYIHLTNSNNPKTPNVSTDYRAEQTNDEGK